MSSFNIIKNWEKNCIKNFFMNWYFSLNVFPKNWTTWTIQLLFICKKKFKWFKKKIEYFFRWMHAMVYKRNYHKVIIFSTCLHLMDHGGYFEKILWWKMVVYILIYHYVCEIGIHISN
jgi:hypothetical protein